MLPRLIGMQRAKEMILTGRILTAYETRDLCLVRSVYEPDDPLPQAIALGAEIASNPTSTLKVIKRQLMEDLLPTDLTTVQRRSNENFAAARKTPAHREALYALRNRRPPPHHPAHNLTQKSDG